MRGLSQLFVDDLQNGCLNCFLRAVKADDTLCMEIREDYVNIYYRGGSLYRIRNMGNHTYSIDFDMNYLRHDYSLLSHFDTALFHQLQNNQGPYEEYVRLIPAIKTEMDLWFGEHPKYEREYQQLVLRENSYSEGVAKDSDYFILDIEYTDANSKGRFDMLAVKWLSTSSQRRNAQNASLALIEMKYADGAHGGSSGIAKHFKDIESFLSSPERIEALINEAENIFNQKLELGLIKGIKPQSIHFNHSTDSLEFIILAANHKPASTVFHRELRSAYQMTNLSALAEIKIATASNMGYGLYADHMVDLEKYLNQK